MLVTIATFSFPHEAHLAKSKLDAMEVPSFIADEHTVNMNWLYSHAMGGIRLQVPAEYAAQAQEILNEPAVIEAIPELEEDDMEAAPACPTCGGILSEPYEIGRTPTVLTWLLLGIPLWFPETVRKCTACGKTTRA